MMRFSSVSKQRLLFRKSFATIMQMRKSDPKTPLLALLRLLNDEQRVAFAADAGTTVSYLYSLAGCQRQSAGSTLALAIESASRRLSEQNKGATPVVCMQTLATMCMVRA